MNKKDKKESLTLNDFTRFKNAVVHLERILSFVKNSPTEEKYRTDNIAKTFYLLVLVSLDK